MPVRGAGWQESREPMVQLGLAPVTVAAEPAELLQRERPTESLLGAELVNGTQKALLEVVERLIAE